MPDFADLAAEREQIDTARAIAAARIPQMDMPVAHGLCHNCDDVVPPSALFCDSDCRDDWQRRRSAQR